MGSFWRQFYFVSMVYFYRESDIDCDESSLKGSALLWKSLKLANNKFLFVYMCWDTYYTL